MDSTERRHFPRFSFCVDVVYRLASSKDLQSVTKNISRGGVCIIAYERVRESDVLELQIFPPGDTQGFIVNGKVAWVKEFVVGDPNEGKRYDVGVEFLDMDPETAGKLNSCLFTLKPS